jgi:UDP-N-acetylmuramate dehydrogenase
MDMAELSRFTLHDLAGEFRMNESMRKHTSWRAGGPAQRAYFPHDLDDLARFVRTMPKDEPVYIIGLGSNLLVRDGGLRGTVVFTHGGLGQIRTEDKGKTRGTQLVYAEAGVASPKVARFAANHNLVGAEFLAGIPGTVGGALAMNAGCYGSETWEIVHSVLRLRDDGELVRRTPSEFEIDYRYVAPRACAGTDPATATPIQEWFAAAWFKLPHGNGEQSRRAIKELLERRIATQPLDQPNAGSVFRNPPGDYAARLIESCGLKGFAIGGAMVSPKHANFIVNTQAATAADIEALIDKMQATVWERCGIQLEREVRIIGEKA